MRHPIQIVCENAGLSCRSYSGRNMYGSECLAVEADSLGEVLVALIAGGADMHQNDLLREERDDGYTPRLPELKAAARKLKSDNMGKGMIFYFPGIAYESS